MNAANLLPTNDTRPRHASRQVRITQLVCGVAMVLVLTGCAKQLLGSLDEMAANQVVSALRSEGISADKSSSGEKTWKVTVADADFARAVQIVEQRNLPPVPFQGLGQVFKKESLVSTPTEERARLVHAMSQELERSLMEMDGVLLARVHPVILPHDPLNPKRVAASASVLIKYRSGTDMSGKESMVRALVAAGVEGLSYDDVRVVMVAAQTPIQAPVATPHQPSAMTPVSSGTPSRLFEKTSERLPPLYGLVLVLLGLALVLSYVWVSRKKRKNSGDDQKLKGRWVDTVGRGFSDSVLEAGKKNRGVMS
jgi:type III secretion protein J